MPRLWVRADAAHFDNNSSGKSIYIALQCYAVLAGVPNVSYIIVKLDAMLTGNVQLSVTFHGVTTNTGIISVSP